MRELIEMRMHHSSHRVRRTGTHRLRLLAAIAGAVCLALLLAAASASAAVSWNVTLKHGPQNFEPGGRAQYIVQPFNVGDRNTAGQNCTTGLQSGCLIATVELPEGVTYDSANPPENSWTCSSTLVGRIETVRCWRASTGVNIVYPTGTTSGRDAVFRGEGHLLVINVLIDGAASGTLEASAQVFGAAAGTCRDPNQDPSNAACVASDVATDSATVSDAPNTFGFVPDTFEADAFDSTVPTGGIGGTPVRQAGAHPFEMRVRFDLTTDWMPDGSSRYVAPAGTAKTLETRLPAGLIGDPQATPQCDPIQFSSSGWASKGNCPVNTQVGTADLVLQDGRNILTPLPLDVPVYNMEPPRGTVAAFALSFIARPVWIIASVDPADHYSVIAAVYDTTGVVPTRSIDLALWGVPGDPAHDALRLDPNAASGSSAMTAPFTAPIKPFLTMPSQCDVPGAVSMRADSWENRGVFAEQKGADALMTGCDDARFQFEPTISVRPDTLTPNAPTGLDVDIAVPRKDDTVLDATDLYEQNGRDVAINTPPVRNVTVVMPEGMRVSPSGADGLAACSPMQIGLGTNDKPTCPDGAKIGTATIDTPLLPDPLSGDVFLAAQNDNPFGTTLALYIAVSGPGVIVKLPGKVETDPVTGQLTATFEDNPQLPFSHLNVHFNGGPRAQLVTPPTCGAKTASATITSWNSSLPAVQADAAFEISGDGTGAPCAPQGFDPSFTAGTVDSTAGKNSPLVTRFSRSDADEELSGVEVTMPQGLLGRIADLVLCSDGQANAGTCGDGSRIGTVVVGAGPGPNPYYITDGRVHMTGPYKGAPFGLSIVVHAKAGPIDLGVVVVRAAVHVDKHTAALRIVSDPLPTILEGIPLQMRVVDIAVDKPGFTFNPTNCSETSATATLRSTGGQTSSKSSRFQAGDCAALPFEPRMKIRVGGRRRTQRGRSTRLAAAVRMAPGQANLRGVKVTLPTTINARLPVINEACTRAEFEAGNCEEARAGTAVAVTPLLRDPLRGNVYFVRNGNPLPDVMVALRGQVDFDLIGRVSIPGSKRLRTNFDTVPDVPITKFVLRFVAGKNGPVGNAANLCEPVSRRLRMGVSFVAQNGKSLHRSQRLGIRGCKKAKGKRAKGKRAKAKRSSGGTARTR